MMKELEKVVKNYIKKEASKSVGVKTPLSKIAEELNSSTASVWRAVKNLEKRKVIKVVKPDLKTEPNLMFYIGENEEVNDMLDDLMVMTSNLLIVIGEVKRAVNNQSRDLDFDPGKQKRVSN